MTGPVAAVTLDLDDTVFPQDEWLAGAWAAVADRGAVLGLEREPLLRALVRTAAEGSDRGRIVDRALAAVGVPPESYVGDLVAAFTGHAPARLTAYPGALEAVRQLTAVVPVALITDGNPRIQHGKVAALGLDRLLAHVVVSDELGGRDLRKPHPAPFRRALALLDLPAERVVHVGDRPAKDVAGAQAVGMRVIRVHTGEYAGLPDPAGLRPWRSTGDLTEAVALLLPLLVREQDGAPVRL
jgi:HAD superfamily hydrolase (TIGR01509 family)